MELSLELKKTFKMTYVLHALSGSFIPDADKLSNQKRALIRPEYRPIFDECRRVIAKARELEETRLKEFELKKFKYLSDKIRANNKFLDAVHERTVRFVCKSLKIDQSDLRLLASESSMYYAKSEKYKAMAERCVGKAETYNVSSSLLCHS